MIASLLRKLIPEHWRPIGYLNRFTYDRCGGSVRAGPFRGMKYIRSSFYSAYLPKILGIYERELHPLVERACARGYDRVIDIGAAEGYYAVGFALRIPRASVIAFEMEEVGRELLGEMCRLNHVASRVEVRGKCEPGGLQSLLASGPPTLLVVDCEGYEKVLLDPAAVPGLRGAAIIVELHDFLVPGLAEELTRRFTPTHDVERVWQTDRAATDYPFHSLYLATLPRRYREWAVSEWRPERMSWLWMEPRRFNLDDSRS